MSRRELKRYLNTLSKEELEEQISDLYERLKEVREFYNFVFNPKEDKLADEARFKISREYFPPSGRKPKKRRSVAQKYIRTFLKLGVEPKLIADIMIYNVEVAVAYHAEKAINQDAFYKSMQTSFAEAVKYVYTQGLLSDFRSRLEKILREIESQQWQNVNAMETIYEKVLFA